MPQFRLPWPVDLKGYEVKAGRPALKRPDASKKLKRQPRSAVIAARGGQAMWYDAMDCAGLYHRFASFPATQRGALDFVTEYGLLGKGGMGEVNEICAHIRRVKELIGYKEERDWNRLREWMEETGEAIYLHPELLPDEQAMLLRGNRKVVRLRPAQMAEQPPAIFFRPRTLIDAIYLMLFSDVSSGAKLKKCEAPGCVEWFRYGVGTGRRSTGQYCGPRCQQSAKYVTMKEDGRR